MARRGVMRQRAACRITLSRWALARPRARSPPHPSGVCQVARVALRRSTAAHLIVPARSQRIASRFSRRGRVRTKHSCVPRCAVATLRVRPHAYWPRPRTLTRARSRARRGRVARAAPGARGASRPTAACEPAAPAHTGRLLILTASAAAAAAASGTAGPGAAAASAGGSVRIARTVRAGPLAAAADAGASLSAAEPRHRRVLQARDRVRVAHRHDLPASTVQRLHLRRHVKCAGAAADPGRVATARQCVSHPCVCA
jgi:hypothetical protein